MEQRKYEYIRSTKVQPLFTRHQPIQYKHINPETTSFAKVMVGDVGEGSISRNGFLGLALADNEIEPDRMSDQISLFIESTVE